ncbi:MAG: RNase adapter RapZ [Candidatus Eisenbacteria bacterium]
MSGRGPEVHIVSFSYHAGGIPADTTGHGGGFVFDCRVLPNPGREEGYRAMTGRDGPVAAWIEGREESARFWERVRGLVDEGVKAYGARGFTDLSVAFGCTGGQHRSVYFAERLYRHLRGRGVPCDLRHREFPELSP